MSLHRYVASRLLQSLILVFVVLTLGFFIIRTAPGDPVLYLYGSQNVSAETLEQARRVWGLDRPLSEQYFTYLGNLARGDLGHSQIHQQPVRLMLTQIIPNTLLLMVPSLLIAVAGGVFLGSAASQRMNSWRDYLIGACSMVGYSTPPFWLGIIFIIVFATRAWVASDPGYGHAWFFEGGDRALGRCRPAHGASGGRIGVVVPGRLHAAHARLHAGGVPEALPDDRPHEGPVRDPGRLPPRAPERGAPGPRPCWVSTSARCSRAQ